MRPSLPGRARLRVGLALALAQLLVACAPTRPVAGPRRRPRPASTAGVAPTVAPSPAERAPAAAAAAAAPPRDYQRLVLPSGLPILVQPSRAAQLVSVQVWVRAGAGDDPEGQEGLAHFFEHMLFRATAKRPVGQIAREIEQAGGDLNARTTHDQTVFHIVLPKAEIATAFDVIGDALVRRSLDDQEVERERTVILDEIRKTESDPTRRMAQLLFAHSGTARRYTAPIVGTQKSVKAIRKEALIEFYRRHYAPSNLVLVVAGNVTPAEVKALALQHLQSLASEPSDGTPAPSPAPRAIAATSEHEARGLRVHVEERTGPLRVGVAFPAVALADDDAAALDLLATLLGRGDAARLLRHLRDEEELATTVEAWAHTARHDGLFVVEAQPVPGQLAPLLNELGEELFRLRYELVPQAELDRARTLLESSTVFGRETVAGQARRLGMFEVLAGDAALERRYAEHLRALTPATLRELAEYYLDPDRATLVVTGRGVDEAGRLKTIFAAAAARAEERYAAQPPKGKGSRPQIVERTGDIVRTTLASGLRLLILPDASSPVVAARALWLGGQRLEDERSAGLHHLLAQLLVRGTRTRTTEQITTELDTIAASLSGVAGQNSFSVELEVLSRHWERGFELLADCILYPRFADGDVEREKRLLLGSIGPGHDSSRRRVERAIREALYPRHPYRFDLEGTPESVAGLTRRRLAEAHRTELQPSQMVLAVVGDVEPEAVIRKVRALFDEPPPGRLRARPSLRAATLAPPAAAVHRTIELDRQIGVVGMGFLGATFQEPDRAAAELLVAMLDGQGGRLFVELRDRAALGYDVSATATEGIERGHILLLVTTAVERVAEAEQRLWAEVERLQKQAPPIEELERARRWLLGALAARLERRAALASSIAFAEAIGLGWDSHERSRAQLSMVTPEQVRAVAARLFDPQRAVVVIARPAEEKKIAAPPGPRTSNNLKRSGKRRR